MHSYKIDTALKRQEQILTGISRQVAEASRPERPHNKSSLFVMVGDQRVRVYKSTRRLIRLSYLIKQRLARIKRLRQLIEDMEDNYELRQQVKTLKAAKREPHHRLRTRDELASVKMPAPFYMINNRPQVVAPRYMYQGERQNMNDWVPTLRSDIPRNAMNAERVRIGASLSSGNVSVPSKGLVIDIPRSRWCVGALSLWAMSTDISTATTFDSNVASKVLIKAHAEMNAAVLQINEYVVEFAQVLRLLKDPVKTIGSFSRTIKQWVGKDAWLMIPNRTIRRFGHGSLVSKAPTGVTLMSMRTKKQVNPFSVAWKVREEAANRWLQYRYGIAPMAADVAVVTGLLLRPKPDFPIKNAQAKLWVTPKSKISNELLYKFQPVDALFRFTATTGKFYTCKVWYQLKHEVPVSYKYGLHPIQLANTIWNAAPWSFVADWAINVDDWLKAINRPPWITILGNVVTAKEFTKVKAELLKANWNSSPYYPLIIKGLPFGFKSKEKVNRHVDVVDSFEWPSLEDKWKTAKNLLTGLSLGLNPLLQSTKR